MRRLLAAGGGLALLAGAAGLAWALAPASGSATGVTVTGGSAGAPCPDVEIAGARARGGCVVDVPKAPAALAALTAFGDHRLARCMVGFELRIGGSGELALTGLVADDLEDRRAVALGVSEACGDVLACRRVEGADYYPTARDKLPWPGRVVASGSRLTAELDACFDTCLGRFEGTLSLDLAERAGGGWDLAGRRAAVGDGGLELDGRWALDPRAGEQLTVAVAGR